MFVSLILILSHNIKAQQVNHAKYQDSMSIALKENPNVKDFFFDTEYYKNKQLKKQKLYIKFKSDSIDRYIHVGKCFHYRKNGQLKHAHQKDITLLCEMGLEIFYNKKGQISFIVENKLINISELSQLDTAKYIDIKNDLSKHYYVKDSGLVFFTGKHDSRNLQIANAVPRYYLVVDYYKGCKSDYTEYWYDPAKKEYIKLKKEKYLVDPED